MSNHSQSTLMPMPSQSQVNQPYTNVGYSNLKNLKNLKNYGSLTLRTIEKRWQFHGKKMALTFEPR